MYAKIRSMCIKIRSRLQNKEGFSLGETLVAMLILLLAASIVAAGIPAARNAYEKVVRNANAQVLLSTTITRLRDELGTANEIKLTSSGNNGTADTITYISSDTGAKSKIYMGDMAAASPDERGIHIQEYDNDVFADKTSDTIRRLVPKTVGGSSIYAKYDSVEWSPSGDGLLVIKDLQVVYKEDSSNEELIAGPIDELKIRVIGHQA